MLDAARTFDVVVAMYGRLRTIARAHRGRVGAVRLGRRRARVPRLDEPVAVRPARAAGARRARTRRPSTSPRDDEKGYRIVRTEAAVFAHHPDAAHFRYPYVYGPYQLVPREWSIVRRILDGRDADRRRRRRPHAAPPRLHGEPRARAAARGRPARRRRAGKIFNVGDEEVLSVRQVVELVAAALGHALEIVSMPYDLAVPARPLLAQPLPTHRVLDLAPRARASSATATSCPPARRSP